MATESIAPETAPRNPSILRIPDNLSELQQAYGESCSKYEQLADKSLKKSGVIVVSGIGSTLCVRNDALSIIPGKTYAAQKQEPVSLYRGVHGISHIIMLANKKGSITLDALAWCESQDIRLSILDFQGTCIQSFSSSHADARLRRLQYAAADNGMAGMVSCELVKRKIEGQRDTLLVHPELPGRDEAVRVLNDALAWFLLPSLPTRFYDIDWLRTYEGRAADAYFRAWKGLLIKWDKGVVKSIPPHWKSVAERSSPLSKNHGARWATNPAQAILNYAYALLESQVRQSLNADGFDCVVGFLHADVPGRDSLVYDIMEEFRPRVDDLVLKFLKKTTFAKGDVMSSADGTVKFNPELSRYIVASCRIPQKDIDQTVSSFKQFLLQKITESMHATPV
jgi:CRISPR-associated protein Cas1